MNLDWNEIGRMFITAFLGASTVKILDWIFSRFSERRNLKRAKIDCLLDQLNEYGELVELYRFFAQASSKVVTDESGKILRDETGKPIIETKLFEPDPKFVEALRDIKGGEDLRSIITQKIVSIRLKASKVNDCSIEIDPTGNLMKDFTNLHTKTVLIIGKILDTKDLNNPASEFSSLIDAMKEADEQRRKIKTELTARLTVLI